MKFPGRSWSSYAILPLALFLLTQLGCTSLPNSTVAVLEGADQFRIFRLEPNEQSEKADETVFHGHVILGQADVKDANTRAKISDIVNRGVRKGGTQAKCFNPRHGVHATRAGTTVDLVICYECSIVDLVENGHSTTLGTGNVQSELDDAFSSAGLAPLK